MPAANLQCAECGAPFHRKPSHAAKPKKWGVFCSTTCLTKRRGSFVAQAANPNWKGKNTDSDGYRIHVPQASLQLGLGRMKEHQAVACIALGVERVPDGLHVHHRDCDVLNNEPWNLALMNASDHKWLHKQFGNATLWAFMRGRVESQELASWSDDPARAEHLLLQNIQSQALILRGAPSREAIANYISSARAVRCEIKEIPA